MSDNNGAAATNHEAATIMEQATCKFGLHVANMTKIVTVNVKLEAMKIANADREANGSGPAYGEAEFLRLLDELK